VINWAFIVLGEIQMSKHVILNIPKQKKKKL